MVATINRDELKAKIDRGERFRLVETLPEPAFQKAHLPGAVNPAAGPAARASRTRRLDRPQQDFPLWEAP